jgi:hypothetical protein
MRRKKQFGFRRGDYCGNMRTVASFVWSLGTDCIRNANFELRLLSQFHPLSKVLCMSLGRRYCTYRVRNVRLTISTGNVVQICAAFFYSSFDAYGFDGTVTWYWEDPHTLGARKSKKRISCTRRGWRERTVSFKGTDFGLRLQASTRSNPAFAPATQNEAEDFRQCDAVFSGQGYIPVPPAYDCWPHGCDPGCGFR